jgi:hypothetical protein
MDAELVRPSSSWDGCWGTSSGKSIQWNRSCFMGVSKFALVSYGLAIAEEDVAVQFVSFSAVKNGLPEEITEKVP